MTVISDTNILSSRAAAHAVDLLRRLFARSTVSIPSAVRDEIHAGFAGGRTYLASVVDAVATGDIPVVPLTGNERALAATLPRGLNNVKQSRSVSSAACPCSAMIGAPCAPVR